MQAEPSKTLLSVADIALANADQVIDRVLDHMVRYEFAVSRDQDGGTVTFLVGEVLMQTRVGGLHMRATAAHDAGLAYIKSVMAGHVIEYADSRPEIVWTGDGADATAFPNFREMSVTRVHDITPHMRRITLSGSNLESFVSGALHLKLLVPPSGVTEPEWPVPGKDGLAVWPSDDKRPSVRTYTIRRIDGAAGTMDVDFVIHAGHSVGSLWATNAKPGDIVGIRGPVGRATPEVDWYLLVGDEAALPAIARTLETLPTNARGIALIEVDDESERQDIEHETGIEVRWLYRDGAEPGTTTLLPDAVRAVEMPPQGTSIYAMAGVEAEAFKTIRHHWREVLKLDKKDVMVSTYWRKGAAEDE